MREIFKFRYVFSIWQFNIFLNYSVEQRPAHYFSLNCSYTQVGGGKLGVEWGAVLKWEWGMNISLGFKLAER